MRALVAIGVVLIVAGAIGLFSLLFAIPTPELAGTPDQVVARAQAGPSVGWSVLAGLTLALGGACLGIGMNAWKQGSPRTIQRPPR